MPPPLDVFWVFGVVPFSLVVIFLKVEPVVEPKELPSVIVGVSLIQANVVFLENYVFYPEVIHYCVVSCSFD